MWHKVIFKGDVARVRYECSLMHYGFDHVPRYHVTKQIERESVTFLERMSNEPTLDVGETVYIPELDNSYLISEKSTILGGGIIYHVHEDIETIEDEETKKSMERAEQRLEDLTKTGELIREVRSLKTQLDNEKYKNSILQEKKWWQVWK